MMIGSILYLITVLVVGLVGIIFAINFFISIRKKNIEDFRTVQQVNREKFYESRHD